MLHSDSRNFLDGESELELELLSDPSNCGYRKYQAEGGDPESRQLLNQPPAAQAQGLGRFFVVSSAFTDCLFVHATLDVVDDYF